MSKNCDFSSALGSTLKIRPKMTSRSSPASLRVLPGRPRWSQEALRALQDDSKRAARAAHMRSQSGLGGHSGQTSRPRASPSGRNFGTLGARFWLLRGVILDWRPSHAQERPGSFGTMLNLLFTLALASTHMLPKAFRTPSGLDFGRLHRGSAVGAQPLDL